VIDNREIEMPAGSTLLQAARRLGIDVPALCYRDGCRPNTSCMVCVMRVRRSDEGEETGRLVPSCATVVEHGMVVESETPPVREARRTALELLLSDHAGQCRAPCQYACPFHTDIPRLMRQVAARRFDQAGVTLRSAMPLATILAPLATPHCERACRRREIDAPAAIGVLMRYVARRSPLPDAAQLPPRRPDSGKRVVVSGAGPAGLSAAWSLAQCGHGCVVLAAGDKAGAAIRAMLPEPQAPSLDAEIALIEKLGVRFELRSPADPPPVIEALRRQFDAVLLTTHEAEREPAVKGQAACADGPICPSATSGVFVVAEAARPARLLHAAVEGQKVAACIDQYLRGQPVSGPRRLTALRTGRPPREQVVALAARASPAPCLTPDRETAELTDEQAQAEARRCLHCDCFKLETCQLRKYAERYGADAARYRGTRRIVRRLGPHPKVICDPGKCILCGLCIQLAEQFREPLGLTFIGRGFDVNIGVPFGGSLAEGLKQAARQCAEACPTGALSLLTEEARQAHQSDTSDDPGRPDGPPSPDPAPKQ